jgi:hypothetical protein
MNSRSAPSGRSWRTSDEVRSAVIPPPCNADFHTACRSLPCQFQSFAFWHRMLRAAGMVMPAVGRSDEHGCRLRQFPGARPTPHGRWIAGAYQLPTALVTAAKPSNGRTRERQSSSCREVQCSGSVALSGEFGTTASDLCQHVDQHFEIGGLYTFKHSMSLFVNWTLDDREQLPA